MMKKRCFGGLLALLMCVNLLVPMTASAEEYTPLTYNEEVTVTLTVGETRWYQFTPDTTKTYVFTSSNEDGVDPIASLYDSSMTCIATNDDDDGSNFCVVAELEAGQTYYLEAYEFDMDNEGSYTLVVGSSMPTDIALYDYALTVFSGTEYTLDVMVYPEDSDQTLTWTSSDESVATVDENGKITFLAEGEIKITAETVNGLTDTCWFEVLRVDGSMVVGETKTIECTGYAERNESRKYFTFTPTETGYYRIYSYDIVSANSDPAVDPRLWVYDALYNEIAYNDDGGEEVNASAEAALQANVTYYIVPELYDCEAIGSFKLCIEELMTADSVSIDCGDLYLEQGSYFDIYVTYSPANSWKEDYYVTSSDESVIKVDDKTILAVGGGEATVTVMTDLGLTDSIQVTVESIDEMALDTVYTLEGTESDYGACARYAFTPSVSGRYTIASSEAIGEDALVNVQVSNAYESLRSNNTESSTFKLTYELEAGVTYYYDVTLNCSGGDSAVDFKLTKEDDASIIEAKLNTDYDVDIINPGDGVYYTFTPTLTGLYAIFSQEKDDIFDTKLMVFDDEWNLFYSNDDGSDNSQYRLEEEFTGGETYYLKSIMYSDTDIGSYVMRIEPLFDLPTVGDVDGDGALSTSDARMVLNAILERTDLTEDQQSIADVNGDGQLTSSDVRTILLRCVTAE